MMRSDRRSVTGFQVHSAFLISIELCSLSSEKEIHDISDLKSQFGRPGGFHLLSWSGIRM